MTKRDGGEPLLVAEVADALQRQGHRARRATLTDSVTVERIGDLDKTESFQDATHDLNEENWQKKHPGESHSSSEI